jgi:hypothetical protein
VTGHRRGRSIDLTFMYCSSASDAGSARRRRHHSGATRRRRLLSRTGGSSSVPQAARGPNQPILSGTASEDRLAPTARSANITWSRDADEFRLARVQGEGVRLGHLVAAFTVQQIPRAAGIGSAPARPDLEAGPARPGRRHSRGRFRARGHRAAPTPPRPDHHRALAAAPAGPYERLPRSPPFTGRGHDPGRLEYGCSRLHRQRVAWRQAGIAGWNGPRAAPAAGPPAGRGDL